MMILIGVTAASPKPKTSKAARGHKIHSYLHRGLEPLEGQTIVSADLGFRDRDGVPDHLKLCTKGSWNERVMVETALSMVTVVCGLNHLHHRVREYLKAASLLSLPCSTSYSNYAISCTLELTLFR